MANRFKVIGGGPYPHFMTMSIVRWMPVFVSGDYFDIIMSSLVHLREHRGLQTHAYVIMPTHLHLMSTAVNDDLSAIVRDFKKFTSRAIHEKAENQGDQLLTWFFRRAAEADPRSRFKVWQDEYHPEVIYSREFFEQKVDYIHTNPVRKGLVADATNWYYSSAAQYFGQSIGPFNIDWIEW